MSAKANTQVFAATGRRKASVARVRLSEESKGKVVINGKAADDYCSLESFLGQVYAPLKTAEKQDQFDLSVNVFGGGTMGQAGAIRLGIARALEKFDEELRSPLKSAGFLRRDSRVRERRSPANPGRANGSNFLSAKRDRNPVLEKPSSGQAGVGLFSFSKLCSFITESFQLLHV